MKPRTLLVPGCSLLALSAMMMVVGASIFVMTAPPPPLIDLLGRVCFFGWIFPGIAGLVLVILFATARQR